MKTITYFRLALLALLFSTTSLATQAQVPQTSFVPREGFWVTESAPGSRQCIVRFYNNHKQLIYEETVARRLNIARLPVKRQLNAALEQAMFVWNATQKVPTDRQWVAIQFVKK